MFWLLQFHLLFIALQLSAIPFTLSMNTRKKNKAAHPGIPDMTPSQLASAGLSHASNARRSSIKKLTNAQRIAALEEELSAAREFISMVGPLLRPMCIIIY